jgi:hypothetical protein
MGDLDRRKTDVDVIERVIGGIQESADGSPGRVIDVEIPTHPGSPSSIVEVVVNIPAEGAYAPEGWHEAGPGRSS